jgi:hypothetical protein
MPVRQAVNAPSMSTATPAAIESAVAASSSKPSRNGAAISTAAMT